MAGNMKHAWRSQRLVYRTIMIPEDEGFLMEHMNDPHGQSLASPGLLYPPGKQSLERFKQWLETNSLNVIVCIPNESPSEEESKVTKETRAPKNVENWVARQKAQLIEIGCLHLQGPQAFTAHHREVEIGIRLGEQHRGKGYGSEAIEWVLQYAFNHAAMHRVSIGAFAFNETAWKLYEKLGFRREGRLVKAVWFNGEWHDVVLLAMLEDEWRARRQAKKQLPEREKEGE